MDNQRGSDSNQTRSMAGLLRSGEFCRNHVGPFVSSTVIRRAVMASHADQTRQRVINLCQETDYVEETRLYFD